MKEPSFFAKYAVCFSLCSAVLAHCSASNTDNPPADSGITDTFELDGAIDAPDEVGPDTPMTDASGDAAADCEASGLNETFVAEWQSTVEQKLAEVGAPGIVAGVSIQCEGTYIGSAGLADVFENKAMPTDGLLRLGSITKTYVAALILSLAQQGDLSLSDTIDLYVPEQPGGAAITLGQLLNHTSGLFNYTDDDNYRVLEADPAHVFSHQDLLDMAWAHPPYFAPGADWHYSNTNYILLGLVAEQLGETTLGKLLRSLLLQLCSLNRTYFGGEEEIPPADMVSGYGLTGQSYQDQTDTPHFSAPWASGAMVASAADLLAWGEALFMGSVLPADWQATMMTCVDTGQEGQQWGYGVFCKETAAGISYGHSGGIDGYTNLLLYIPAKKALLTVLSNAGEVNLNPLIQSLITLMTLH